MWSQSAQTRARPRGALRAGSITSATNELCGVIHGRELELLLGAEVGEEAALAHAGRLGEPADRQRLETFLGRERRGRLQDGVARPLALGS